MHSRGTHVQPRLFALLAPRRSLPGPCSMTRRPLPLASPILAALPSLAENPGMRKEAYGGARRAVGHPRQGSMRPGTAVYFLPARKLQLNSCKLPAICDATGVCRVRRRGSLRPREQIGPCLLGACFYWLASPAVVCISYRSGCTIPRVPDELLPQQHGRVSAARRPPRCPPHLARGTPYHGQTKGVGLVLATEHCIVPSCLVSLPKQQHESLRRGMPALPAFVC